MTGESLKGKTALVTGAAKRIGRATALALAGEGADVVVHYNASADEANLLVDEIVGRGVRAWSVKADFGKPGEYETLIERAAQIAGGIDILVNSASIFPIDKLEDVTFDGLMQNVEVNAWVPFALSRAFKEYIGSADTPVCGKIVNMVDSRITGYDWSHVGYIWSKHVLAAMTRMTALAYAPEITVNAVAPGLILPPPGKDQSYIERLTGTVPLKKHGEPEDIADAILFLVKSDFITGQVIYVDGGRHLKEFTDG